MVVKVRSSLAAISSKDWEETDLLDCLARTTKTAQEEREYAIKSFKTGKKDVMVASGVASKGLDFSEIQHVINFTMPKEIEVSFLVSALALFIQFDSP